MARYISTVIMGRNGSYYPVVDTATGKWVRVEGCQLWADKRAKEYNDGKHQERGRSQLSSDIQNTESA